MILRFGKDAFQQVRSRVNAKKFLCHHLGVNSTIHYSDMLPVLEAQRVFMSFKKFKSAYDNDNALKMQPPPKRLHGKLDVYHRKTTKGSFFPPSGSNAFENGSMMSY